MYRPSRTELLPHEPLPSVARKPGRLRRALAGIGWAAGLAAVFAGATVAGVHVHVDLPVARRVAVEQVNKLLGGTFRGQIKIHRLDDLHLTRIEGLDGEVLDPEGKRALLVYGVDAKIGTFTILRSLVGDELVVRIPELTIRGAEVVIEQHDGDELSIQRAFESREPAPAAEPGGGEVQVTISEVHIGHAWIHGSTDAVPLIDSDLDDVTGTFVTNAKTTDIVVRGARVRGRGMPGKDPDGAVLGWVSLPAGPNPSNQVFAHYHGQIGDVAVVADGSMVGKRVAAVVDVPSAMPAAIAALTDGQVQLGAAADVHAMVHGELPVLVPEVRARIGGGEIGVSGVVALPDEVRTDLFAVARVNVKDLDLSLLQADAPRSRLTSLVETSAVVRGKTVAGTFILTNQVGEVSGRVVPALGARGEYTERSVRGEAEIAERGAPTSVLFSLRPRAGSTSPNHLDLRAETSVANLHAVERLGRIGRGRAHLVVNGSLDIDTRRVSARATGQVGGLSVQGVQLAGGFVTADVDGALESPRIVANVRGAGLRAGGRVFNDVRASASGSPQELDVTARLLGAENSPHVAARAHISNRGALTVRGGFVRVEQDETASWARVESVRVAGNILDIRGVTVDGLGGPIEASARIAGDTMSVRAKGSSVDVHRVARLVAQRQDIVGLLSFDADVQRRGSDVKGRVAANVTALSLRSVQGADVRVSASSDGRHVRADVHAGLGEAGTIDVSAPDVELAGPAMRPSAWTAATGTAKLAGALDLKLLSERLPRQWLPFESAAGKVTIRGEASRSSRSAPPSVDLEASTKDLELVAKRVRRLNPDGTITPGPEPWRTVGLDGDFAVRLDEQTGATRVTTKLRDKDGALVSVDASAKLPLAEIYEKPERLLAVVKATPIEARIALPRRSLDAMPEAIGTTPLKGEVEMVAELRGTMSAPNVQLVARATNLLPRMAAPCVRGVDVETTIAYDGKRADVKVAAGRDGVPMIDATAQVNADAAQVLAGGPLAWDASGDIALSAFPLETAGGLIDQTIGGTVSGNIEVQDLHRDARLTANLELQNLSLDRSVIPYGGVHVVMKGGAVEGRARLVQTDGFLETTVKGAMAWGKEIAPDIDLAKAVDLEIHAKSFRVNAAAPFVTGAIEELDGRIDADAKIHIEQGGKDGHMDGAVVIREGVIELPQLGERFHDVQGRALIKPWGTLRLDDFSAKAPTGKLTASATAVMKGFQLQTADAKLKIAKGQSIPITVEGVPLGRAYGEVTAHAQASADDKRIDIHVDVPLLHAELPQSTGHTVQPLEPDKTVRIGRHVDRDFALIPLGPPEEPRAPSDKAIHVEVVLGKDIEVRRDTTLHIVAEGQTTIDVRDKTRVGGQIRLLRGEVELQGKRFTIDRGVVSFVGDDPSDPLIMATAYWDAPDQTRVFVDFSGRASSGRLVLRSEPALTQDEVLSLVLFGTRDGSFGAEQPPGQKESKGVAAVGLAGGVVTQGLNKAISGITSAQIATRVDTSDADNPRPELAVQVSKGVSVRLSYKLGVPAPGQNPDRTELTLDWRFFRNWSLVATVGDQGSTSFDLVWRKRY